MAVFVRCVGVRSVYGARRELPQKGDKKSGEYVEVLFWRNEWARNELQTHSATAYT